MPNLQNLAGGSVGLMSADEAILQEEMAQNSHLRQKIEQSKLRQLQ